MPCAARVGRGLKRLTEQFPQRPKSQTWFAFILLVGAFVLIAVLTPRIGHFAGWMGLASLFLAAFLLVLSWIDLDRFLLPDVLTLPLLSCGLVVGFLSASNALLHILGAGIGYLVIYAISLSYRFLRGRDGIGLGDAKLLAAGGAWVGATALPIILLIASGAGLLFALASRIAKPSAHEQTIPFGPLLSLGIWFSWCVPFAAPL